MPIEVQNQLNRSDGTTELSSVLRSSPVGCEASGEGREFEPLPRPVHFVFRPSKAWDDVVRNVGHLPAIEEIADRFSTDPTPNWVLQTFIQLKQRGLDVRLSDRLVAGEICVIGLWHLSSRELIGRSYNVVVRADCCRPAVADHVIAQNPKNVLRDTDHLIQHWPEPCLLPRDVTRGSQVATLAYRGPLRNLWKPLLSEDFQRKLREMGVRFVTEADVPDEEARASWRDYRNVDLAVAIRNLTDYDANIKPATKLTNAWLAGCPAALGPEPAYQALKSCDLDFLEIRNVDDLLQSVRLLQREPARYSAMLQRAASRSAEFSASNIARVWRDVLAGPVYQGFLRWRQTPGLLRDGMATLQQPASIIRHRLALRRYRNDRGRGPRILDNVWSPSTTKDPSTSSTPAP